MCFYANPLIFPLKTNFSGNLFSFTTTPVDTKGVTELVIKKSDITHTPADWVDVLCVLVFLCFRQTVPEWDETLSEALVDGSTRSGDGSAQTHRSQTWRREKAEIFNDKHEGTWKIQQEISFVGNKKKSIWCLDGSTEYRDVAVHSSGQITLHQSQTVYKLSEYIDQLIDYTFP